MKSVFDRIDGYNGSFLGFNPVGALKNVRVWRRYILSLLVLSLLSWVVFGWESTWSMPFVFVKSFPLIVTGQVTLGQVVAEAQTFYGVGQHLSSFVFYSIAYLCISIHLEKHGIKKSLNFMSSLALTVLSVGAYELIYNVLYSQLQGQYWTFSLVWRQGLNLCVFGFFVVLGVLSLVYLYSLGFKPNFGKITKLLLLVSVLTYVLWVFYPFSSSTLVMNTTSGTWVSGELFPQTMYAVDVDPLDGVAVGVPVFVENDLLHLVNVLNKLFVSLTFLSFSMVRRVYVAEKV